jgi:methionine-R-sulfoxide reductase
LPDADHPAADTSVASDPLDAPGAAPAPDGGPGGDHLPADPARLAALTDLQRAVTAQGATERPFTGALDSTFEPGIYLDITSGEPLFASSQKFDSGCGWPAFARPISPGTVAELEDSSYGMDRTEVRSSGSGAHLGHVFADGPEELGGMRYCINSAALEFVPRSEMAKRGLSAYLPLTDALPDGQSAVPDAPA